MSDHHRNGGSGHGDNTRPEAPIEDYMNELESNFSQDKLNVRVFVLLTFDWRGFMHSYNNR